MGPARRPRILWRQDFNPPTPCGVGRAEVVDERIRGAFQSTHPLRGGTSSYPPPSTRYPFQSTPCGVGHAILVFPSAEVHFNPPTPCGVGLCHFKPPYKSHNFNPPTPCRVGPFFRSSAVSIVPFQSTHPVRGGTEKQSHFFGSCYFNPPTPCGVGR